MQTQDTTHTQIRQLIDERIAAMRGRDAATIIARFAPEIVKFDLSPPLQHLAPEATDVAGLEAWFAGFDGELEYEVRDLQATSGGDVAFCHSLNRLAAVPRGTDYRFTLWFRATLGLRRVDGDWQITHEHNSTPFYMDNTMKAAVDLEP